jgi:hypothetical protein
MSANAGKRSTGVLGEVLSRSGDDVLGQVCRRDTEHIASQRDTGT